MSQTKKATQTSNQTIVEKHDDKKHLLMIPDWGEKGEHVIKSIRKTVRRLLPSNIKVQVPFTGNKFGSCFNIKNKTKFDRRYDVISLGTCSEATCNDNDIDEIKRRIFERVKDHNGREIKSHLLKYALENNHQYVSEKYFKIIGNGFRGNNKKKICSWGITNSRNQTNSEHSSTVGPTAVI